MSNMYKCVACNAITTVGHSVDPSEVMCSICLFRLAKAVDKKITQKESILHKEIDRLQTMITEVAAASIAKSLESPVKRGYM